MGFLVFSHSPCGLGQLVNFKLPTYVNGPPLECTSMVSVFLVLVNRRVAGIVVKDKDAELKLMVILVGKMALDHLDTF